jgi:hypothetical protein
MSSKKEEREALRRSAADSIRPGWNPQNIDAWNPKEDSPQLKHLTEVAKDRGFNGMGFKNRAKAVEWLTLNGPPEAGTGETTLSTFGADTLDFSGTTSPAPLSLNPLATTPYLPPSRHFKGPPPPALSLENLGTGVHPQATAAAEGGTIATATRPATAAAKYVAPSKPRYPTFPPCFTHLPPPPPYTSTSSSVSDFYMTLPGHRS